ncbi:MAG: hypothetical protein AABW85_01980, partial [archaeon]
LCLFVRCGIGTNFQYFFWIGCRNGRIILLALVVLGLVVGVLNISDKEVGKFLVASIALILVGSANLTAANTVVFGLGTIMQTIVVNLARFVAPAALVVALKSIFSMAKEK